MRILFAVLVSLAALGCGREERLATATDPPGDLASAAPGLDVSEALRGRGRPHLPSRAMVAEAKEALGAVLTGEQVYFQRWATFTNAADTDAVRATLGVHLGDLHRWDFSVRGASESGFLAEARGRDDTDAEGITVTLRHRRGQPAAWSVQRRGPCR